MTDILSPSGDWAVLTIPEEVLQTPSGLHLPPTAQRIQRYAVALVAAVGPGGFSDSGFKRTPTIAPGDRVLIDHESIAGRSIEMNGTIYYLLDWRLIVGKIEHFEVEVAVPQPDGDSR